MKKLYQIWWITRDSEYPVKDFLTGRFSWLYREEVRGLDIKLLERICWHLNEISDSGERFEIREVNRDE